MPDALPSVARPGPDAESQGWVEALSGSGAGKEDAIARLHELLLRAARFEIRRRARSMGGVPPSDAEDLASQAAADALMAIMRKLDTYRGESRFTTWAYKFALLEAGVKVRRRAWQGREIAMEQERWTQLPDMRVSPSENAESAELIDAVRRGIAQALTPHQRTVLVAVTLDDVPIDVLAERLATTRGALYKTLHDARQKLRVQLAIDGHDPDLWVGGPA